MRGGEWGEGLLAFVPSSFFLLAVGRANRVFRAAPQLTKRLEQAYSKRIHLADLSD